MLRQFAQRDRSLAGAIHTYYNLARAVTNEEKPRDAIVLNTTHMTTDALYDVIRNNSQYKYE